VKKIQNRFADSINNRHTGLFLKYYAVCHLAKNIIPFFHEGESVKISILAPGHQLDFALMQVGSSYTSVCEPQSFYTGTGILCLGKKYERE